jgi:hypothetical protein
MEFIDFSQTQFDTILICKFKVRYATVKKVKATVFFELPAAS